MVAKLSAAALACVGVLAAGCAAIPGMGVDDGALRVVSDTPIKGFGWPESVGCDTAHDGDICAFAHADGYTVYVPDLVKGEVRIVRLGR